MNISDILECMNEEMRGTETEKPLYEVIGEISAVWTLINIGYYFLIPLFGVSLSYNTAPVFLGLYFTFCAILCIYNFWGVYSKWLAVDASIWYYGLWSLGSVGLLFACIHLYSLTPSIQTTLFTPYTDLVLATPWYFLPKAVEILIQQLLIAVLVLELYFRFHTLRNVIIGYIICFGGAHLVLFWLSGAPFAYAALMTTGAFLTAFVFPYFILKVKHGFVYGYMIHFLFYLLLAVFLHLFPVSGYLI